MSPDGLHLLASGNSRELPNSLVDTSRDCGGVSILRAKVALKSVTYESGVFQEGADWNLTAFTPDEKEAGDAFADRLRLAALGSLLVALSLVWLVCTPHATAQPIEDVTDRMQRLLDNLSKVSIHITADHTDQRHFRGEIGAVTYTVTNSTTELPEIPNPANELAAARLDAGPQCSAARS